VVVELVLAVMVVLMLVVMVVGWLCRGDGGHVGHGGVSHRTRDVRPNS